MNIRNVFLAVVFAVCFVAAANPSPWDSWRSGYTCFEQGEALRERGRYTEAIEMFKKARQSYLAVRAARPDWNQRVIADRLRDCETQIREVNRLLGGKDDSGSETATATDDGERKNDTPETGTSTTDNSEVEALKRQLYQLKAELEHTRGLLQKQRNFETEMAALLRDRRIAEEKLALLEKRYQALQKEQGSSSANAVEMEQRLVLEKMESERGRKRLAALEQQLNELQEQLKTAQLARNAAEKRKMQLEEELKRCEVRISQLQEEKSRAENRAENMSKSSAVDPALKRELEEIAAAYRNVKTQLAQREQELRQVKNELQQRHSEANVSAAEIANLRKRNRQLEEDVKRLSDQAVELAKRLERRNSEDFQAAAAAKATREKLEKEILSLQKELVTLRGNLDAGNAAYAQAERKIKSLEAELLALRADVLKHEENSRELKSLKDAYQRLKAQYDKLNRNFNALAAENRENKMLADAAKPRQAELERAKLVLLEMDRLKRDLAREQRLNAELKEAYNRSQREVRGLRERSAELDAARRKLIELEAAAKEIKRLQEVEKELAKIRGREAELAQVKIRLAELNAQLRQRDVLIADYRKMIDEQKKQLADLQTLREELERLQRSNEEFKAMIASQNSELDRLNNVLKEAGKNSGEKVDRAELERYRKLAAQIGPLTDRLRKLQAEVAEKERELRARIEALTQAEQRSRRDLQLREKELAELRKINAELADYRNVSAESLRNKVDSSRLARLDSEVDALNKLNAQIAADRDKLQADLDHARNGGDSGEEESLVPTIAPEQAASNGMIAEKDGKVELAIWNYQQALAGDDSMLAVHLRLGMLLTARGNFSSAVPHLSRAFAAYPDNIDLGLALTRCHLELKRFGNAQGVIEALLAKNGENAKVQMYAAMTDAGCGNMVRAEERLQTALRLEPQNGRIYLELAKILAASVADRRSEAALAYESARRLGCDPEPYLEKKLGDLLDHRRELVRFLNGAAREAELGKDWNSAVWYYKKIVAEKHPEYVPHLAFAQWKSGNVAGARETLEFHKPSRLGMVVLTIIALDEKDETAAMRAAQQSVGAKIPAEWVGMNLEVERLKKENTNSSAIKMLLQGISR